MYKNMFRAYCWLIQQQDRGGWLFQKCKKKKHNYIYIFNVLTENLQYPRPLSFSTFSACNIEELKGACGMMLRLQSTVTAVQCILWHGGYVTVVHHMYQLKLACLTQYNPCVYTSSLAY